VPDDARPAADSEKEAPMEAKSPETSGVAAAVIATTLDCFEGWFDGDEARMERALHPNFVKRRAGKELGIMTKDTILELTRRGEGKEDAGNRTLDVEVEDVYGDIASATVRSAVYHEDLLLVRTRNGWKIANALWQLT
jgi:putative lumazine-binding protein